MNERLDRLESAAAHTVAVLESEIAALRIWQSARSSRGALAVPDDIWDGMTISIDKIETVLRKAGIDTHGEHIGASISSNRKKARSEEITK